MPAAHGRAAQGGAQDRRPGSPAQTREINPEDRRSFIVRLTTSGRPAARRVTLALQALEGELASGISARDVAALERIIRALARIAAPR